VTRYGAVAKVEIAHCELLWYLPFETQPVQLILVRDPGTGGHDIALITTDLIASPAQIVERYASRWSIEVAFEEAKQVTGVGQAPNQRCGGRSRLASSAKPCSHSGTPPRCTPTMSLKSAVAVLRGTGPRPPLRPRTC
jgi:hypothetical protein